MGLESGTFVDDLITSNPIGVSDGLNQGDDHLRLIKSVLKTTFPNATKAFRFESILTKTSAYPVVVADARALILADASGGAFIITLPLGSTLFAGYTILVVKSDSSSDVVTVDGNGSETINGGLTRSLTVQYQTEKYTWDGSEWKLLAITRIGTTELLDDSVTFAKMQDITTARLLGRTTASSGDTEQIAVDATMALSSLTLGVAGGGITPTELATNAVETAKINALAVTGPKIAANAINGAHIALGSDAQGDVMFYDGTDWVLLTAGTADQFLQTKGAGADPVWATSGITRRTPIATTSGSAHGFTSIPAGTNRITFMLDEVSLDGGNELLIQIGDAGGYETGGYNSSATRGADDNSSTAGFIINATSSSGNLHSGPVVLHRVDGNIWVSSALLRRTASNSISISSGIKTLTAELDRIQIVAHSGDAFDAGKVNIITEV